MKKIRPSYPFLSLPKIIRLIDIFQANGTALCAI
jgi:hypothetical protein